MKLTIYSKAGLEKLTISPSDGDRASDGIQEDSILSLSFSAFQYVELEVYDYIDFAGQRYWVTEQYKPQMNALKEWSYNVQLHGAAGIAALALMVNTADGDNPNLTLVAPAREHAALIVANLNRYMETSDWKVGEVIDTEYLEISYTGKYISDALSDVSAAAKTEWWFESMTLNISRCEFGEPIELAYGNGLKPGMTRRRADGAKFFTRLFPVGSTRNIDPDKYGHTRLQLPNGATYVEQDTEQGIIEHFEEAAFADIYPRRIGEVSAVRSEEVTGDDGDTFTIYYFKDSKMPFDPNDYEIGGLVKHVVFQSGELRGRDFEVNYDSQNKEFEIITQWPYEDDRQLPSPPMIPQVGDEYVLYNISMPESYYDDAEQEYAEAVEAFMAQSRQDVSIISAQTDYTVVASRDLALRVGQAVRVRNQFYFPKTGYRDTRIIRISRSVVNPGDMTLEMGDVLSTGRITRLESQIADIETTVQEVSSTLPDIIRSWESTPPADTNIFSAKKAMREFLNKRAPDTAYALLTFLQGAHFGDFVSSLYAGRGAAIDASGNAEVESLRVRSSLEVLELVINRLSTLEGDQLLTEGDTIERVDDLGGNIYGLRLRSKWEGYRTSQVANNVLKGIVNTLAAGSGEYHTCWMRVNSVDAAANYLEVTLYPDSEVPAGRNYAPVALMNFSRWGHQTDPTRQRCIYLSTTEGRIVLLNGVTKPILEASNYGATFGTAPEFLKALGLPVSDNDPYVYTRGIITQDILRLDYEGRPVSEVVDRGAWSSSGDYYAEALNPTTKRYEISDVWHFGCRYRCARTGTTSEPAWNNTDWAMIEGNPELGVSFAEGAEVFPRAGFTTTLTLQVKRYNRDITSDISAADVVWTRYSEDAAGNERTALDAAWNAANGRSGKMKTITAGDCDIDGESPGLVRFMATVSSDGSTATATRNITLIAAGTDGKDGRGIESVVAEYQASASGTVVPSGVWQPSIPAAGVEKGEYLWTRTTTTYTSGSPDVVYNVSYYGTDGVSGRGIAATEIRYGVSSNGQDAATVSSWSAAIPGVPDGWYLWTRTTITYTEGAPSVSYSVSRDPVDGKDGRGISATTVRYAVSTQGTVCPSDSDFGTSFPSVPVGSYLWSKTTITYTDGTSKDIIAVSHNAADGEGVTIVEKYVRYAVSTSGTVPPADSAFRDYDNPPEPAQGEYLWTLTYVLYSNGDSTKAYSVSRNGTDGKDGADGAPGAPGADGKDGEPGRGITGVVEWYLATALSSGVTRDTQAAAWVANSVPALTPTNRYLWNYERITYTSGESTYTEPALIGRYTSDGRSVVAVQEYYALAEDGDTAPAWSGSTPQLTEANSHLWGCTEVQYSDGTVSKSEPLALCSYAAGGITPVLSRRYAASASPVSTPTSWSTSRPTLSSSQPYLWQKEVITLDADTVESTPRVVAAYGEDGTAIFTSTVFMRSASTPAAPSGGSYSDPVPSGWSDGIPAGDAALWASTCRFGTTSSGSWSTPEKMEDTEDLEVRFSTLSTLPPSPAEGFAPWSATPTTAAVWMAVRRKTTAWSAWTVSRITGEGVRTISAISDLYIAGADATTLPGWHTTPLLTTDANRYLWNYEATTYSDGTIERTAPAVISVRGEKGPQGEDGKDGENGKDGTDGAGISTVVEFYMASPAPSGVLNTDSGWQRDVPPPLDAYNRYLWNYTAIAYTDGRTPTRTTAAIIGYYAEDGRGILQVVEYYAVTGDKTAPAVGSSAWQTSAPEMTATNRYLWNYERIVYTYGADSVTDPVIIGVYGDTGAPGAVLRGPQSWSDLAEGYFFEAGGAGESWLDVVMYSDQYYICTTAHAKTTTTPAEDVAANAGNWKLGDKMALVATQVLLAEYGVIKNLGAEGLVMTDDDGNVVFRAEEGVVECKGGVFENVLVRSGVANGQRVEINPDSRSVSIYDSAGNECTTLDGNTYGLDDIIPSTAGGAFTLNSNAGATAGKSTTLSGILANTKVAEYQLTSVKSFASAPSTLSVTYSGLKTGLTLNPYTGPGAIPVLTASAYTELVVRTYSGTSMTAGTLLSEKVIATTAEVSLVASGTATSATLAGTKKVSLPKGYHTLWAKVTASKSAQATCTLTGYWNLTAAALVADSFLSRFFANGLALTQNSDNYLAVAAESGVINAVMASNGRVFKVLNGSMYIDGYKQPITLYAGRVYQNSASAAPVITSITPVPTGHAVAVAKSAEGVYDVTFSGFALSIANTMVRVAGFGLVVGSSSAPAKATVISVSTTQVRVMVSDDASPNDGGFYIEVVKYI